MPIIQTRRFDHTAFVVADVDRSVGFYRDVLGLEVIARPAFSFGGAWLRSGDAVIHLIAAHDGNGEPGQPVPDVPHLSRTRHIAFQVSDGRAAAESLAESGHEIVSGPKHRPDGAVQAYVHDPDGHLVELYSDPPA